MNKRFRPVLPPHTVRTRTVLALAVLVLLACGSPAAAACDDAAGDAGCAYAGVLAGSSRAFNRIIDIDGFANWGNPGAVLDYDDVELAGSALVGRRPQGEGCTSVRCR